MRNAIHYPPLITRRERVTKKPSLISLSSYCTQAKVFDVKDMIKYFVQMEDIYNHREEMMKRIEIPKMRYPVSSKWKTTSVYAFCSQIISACLP